MLNFMFLNHKNSGYYLNISTEIFLDFSVAIFLFLYQLELLRWRLIHWLTGNYYRRLNSDAKSSSQQAWNKPSDMIRKCLCKKVIIK